MTKEEICAYAEDLAAKYNPLGLSPFPYERITGDKGDLEIVLAEFDHGISGAIIFLTTEEKFRIIVNKNKPATRQNFTIAHEIGHYFLHKDEIKTNDNLLVDIGENSLDGSNALFRLDAAATTKIETEANNFAAALIMPTKLVQDAWTTLKDVEECAKIFNVSISAMSIRLERLKLI
ncbi:ImmA/IrrE family metallo-endopeptidase [Candidatus Campbellbacteria bacterium]|nr:MAG: ImmA/IrrE family metallo-endopeptidase [Candidatus Campbellbacteria bacterium]